MYCATQKKVYTFRNNAIRFVVNLILYCNLTPVYSFNSMARSNFNSSLKTKQNDLIILIKQI